MCVCVCARGRAYGRKARAGVSDGESERARELESVFVSVAGHALSGGLSCTLYVFTSLLLVRPIF